MKKHLIALILVVLAATLSGCGSEPTGPSKENPFIGGTSGLLISFLENAPPGEIGDGGSIPFNIIVNLENEGEYTIPALGAKVTISGIYPGDFQKDPGAVSVTAIDLKNTINQEITGKRKDTEGEEIQGGFEQVDFGSMKFTRSLQGPITLPVRADVCYTYKTMSSALYCIREDPLSNTEGVCKVSGSKRIYSSSSPLQVTGLTESVAGTDKITLTFTLSHKGNGNIFRPVRTSISDDGIADCGVGRTISDENLVKVTIGHPGTGASLDGAGISCIGISSLEETAGVPNSGFLRLDSQGNGKVTCNINLAAGVNAEREIAMDVEFEYLSTKTTQMDVMHLITS